MNPVQIIGNNIRKLREDKGIKIENLAKHLKITKGRMSQIEHGECIELTIKRIQQIAAYLQVSYFEIAANQPQYTDMNDGKNFSGTNGSYSNFTPELIKHWQMNLLNVYKNDHLQRNHKSK